MKNNQFRVYLDKHIKKAYRNTTILTVDKDSNTRNIYVYTNANKYYGDCIGSLVFYFMNEGMNISYSKNSNKVCKMGNQKASKQFDYCELKQAKEFIKEAIDYFVESKLKGE